MIDVYVYSTLLLLLMFGVLYFVARDRLTREPPPSDAEMEQHFAARLLAVRDLQDSQDVEQWSVTPPRRGGVVAAVRRWIHGSRPDTNGPTVEFATVAADDAPTVRLPRVSGVSR